MHQHPGKQLIFQCPVGGLLVASFEGCLFWMHYQYEDENYPLFFVRLPGLTNANIVQLLSNFDLMYGSINQETTDF